MGIMFEFNSERRDVMISAGRVGAIKGVCKGYEGGKCSAGWENKVCGSC